MLLLIDGLKEKRLATDMNINEGQLPMAGENFSLLNVKCSSFPNVAQYPATKVNVFCENSSKLDEALLRRINHQLALHCMEDASLARGWVKGWIRSEAKA